jgi:hypothetical protein
MGHVMLKLRLPLFVLRNSVQFHDTLASEASHATHTDYTQLKIVHRSIGNNEWTCNKSF